MNNEISKKALEIIKKMQQNELTESYIYEEIATFAKGEENKKTLLRLADEEQKHYEIWSRYTNLKMKPQKGKVLKYKLLARLFGFTFAVKLMENGEEASQKEYELLAREVEESAAICAAKAACISGTSVSSMSSAMSRCPRSSGDRMQSTCSLSASLTLSKPA